MFKRFNFCHSGAEPFSPTRNFARNQRAIPSGDWLGAGSPGAGIAQSHIEHEMDIPSNLAVRRDEKLLSFATFGVKTWQPVTATVMILFGVDRRIAFMRRRSCDVRLYVIALWFLLQSRQVQAARLPGQECAATFARYSLRSKVLPIHWGCKICIPALVGSYGLYPARHRI